MRRTLAKLPRHPVLGRSAAFSSSSSSGGGRGGRINIQFTANESHPGNPDDATESAPPPSQGHGRGRGQPLPSPAFSNRSPIGRGPGFIDLPPPPFTNQQKPSSQIENEDGEGVEVKPGLPAGVANVWSGGGAGRGRITRTFVVDDDDKPKIENRHVRQRPQPEARPPPPPPKDDAVAVKKSSGPQLTREEKVKKAVQILSKGSRDGGGRTGGRRRKVEEEDYSDQEDDDDGDVAVRVMLASELGPELADTVMESFDEAFDNVVPDLEREEYLDALHTNFMLECEPEYIMEEFGTNPDIDDKPIIPLREAFEKQKPFLMTYLGIQDEEEWKEIIEETMKNVPLMKKVVDGYAGPDRITAMEQNKELESIVKTLPAGAPASVKHFAERALLSLQSNPGWGFDKKCLFMEKLVKDVSQQYQ